MKKKLIVLLVVLIFPFTASASEWLRYTMIQKPYYDRRGKILTIEQVNKRNNRWQDKQEFFRDGKIKPKVPYTIIRSFERGPNLFVEYDIDSVQADKIVNNTSTFMQILTRKVKKYQKKAPKYSPKSRMKYNFQNFNPTRCTPQEAKSLLATWGIDIISGVT